MRTPIQSSMPLLLSLVMLLFSIRLSAQNYQSYYWYTGDKEINMSNYSSPTINNISGNPPHAKFITNGAYYTGSSSLPITEFSIQDNYINQYDATNGLISTQFFDLINTTGIEHTSTDPSPEVSVIPKPGNECGTYFIIYGFNQIQAATHTAQSEALCYAEYSTDVQTGLISTGNLLQSINLFNLSSGDIFAPSFAMSKKNTNNQRYLYAVTPYYNSTTMDVSTRVYKYLITSTGITQTDLTPGIANDYLEFSGVLAPSETELSDDQSMLAFARRNTINFPSNVDLVVVKLDPTTGNLLNSNMSNVLTYDLPDKVPLGDSYSGIEFKSDNSTLYINDREDGIRSFNIISGQLASSQITNSQFYSNSQLEMRYFQNGSSDQRICAVKDPNSGSGTYEIGYINNASMSQNSGLNSFLWQFQEFQKVDGVFTLQDQIDGEDYSTWSDPNNSTACCTRYYESPYKEVNAENRSNSPGNNQFGNTNGDVIIENTFTVPSGVICTLSNMVLRFHPGGEVIVEPNARLYLQNTKLTGLSCGTTWNGVRVLGTPSQPQQLAYQGYLNMNTGSEISHAVCGAATYDKESGDLNASGGFIQTNSVSFIDNYQDLAIPYYPSSSSNPSNNFFDLTTFKVDDNYRFGTSLSYRASVTQIYRVYFRGCTFANDCTSPVMQSSSVNTTAGVAALDAYIIVDQKTSQTPCVFRNLYQGILALKWAVNQIFVAQNSQFTNNQKG